MTPLGWLGRKTSTQTNRQTLKMHMLTRIFAGHTLYYYCHNIHFLTLGLIVTKCLFSSPVIWKIRLSHIAAEVELIHFQGRQLFLSFWKGVYSKWKEFAPNGSKIFPLRVDPFSEGDLVCRKAKRKLRKSSPISKIAKNSIQSLYICIEQYHKTCLPASVAQLDAPSDWRPGGRGFNPRRGRQHSFMEIDREIFSTVILSLPLIQEGQLSVSGEKMCIILVNRLED